MNKIAGFPGVLEHGGGKGRSRKSRKSRSRKSRKSGGRRHGGPK